MDDTAAIAILLDRSQIIDVLNRYAVSIDLRNWEDFADCFAETVEMSLPALGGPLSLSRADATSMARAIFSGVVATQHLSANHQVTVDGGEATARSTLNATHYLGDDLEQPTQREVGYYEWHLVRSDGWRIDRVSMTISWVEGNTEKFREIQVSALSGAGQ